MLNTTLGGLIAQQIAESSQQKISFAEFMDLALYHPHHGYYSAGQAKIGAEGDFFTAPHLGSEFGALLAEQFTQMWQVMQRPDPFTLVEMGAGQGLLAADILQHLQTRQPACYGALHYIIIERAAALIAEQKRRLSPFLQGGLPLVWQTWEQVPSNSIVGCCFSNELVDALPVHRVTMTAGELQEMYVTAQPQPDGSIAWREVCDRLSTPRLAHYFQMVGIDLTTPAYADHYRTEVNLAALDWLETVADRLQRGYLLTIDYGYPADRYYHPNRSDGTLQCYYRHAHHDNPYFAIGQQDITAHVDFTALQRHGEHCGLKTVGFTKQGLFLMALGLGDRIAALSQSAMPQPQPVLAVLHRRDALQQLIDPMGLGGFGVLIQSKGIDTGETLRGLRGEVELY